MSNQFNQQIVLDIQAQGGSIVDAAKEKIENFVLELNKATDQFRNNALNIDDWIEKVQELSGDVSKYAKIVETSNKAIAKSEKERAEANRILAEEAKRAADEQEKIRKDEEKKERDSLKRRAEAFKNAIIQRDLQRKEDAKNAAEANRVLAAEEKRAAADQEKIRKDQEKQEKESLKRRAEAFRNAIIQRDLQRKEDAKNEAEANRILAAEAKRAADEQEKIHKEEEKARREEERKEKDSLKRRAEAFRNAIIQRDLDRKEELKRAAEANRILADEEKRAAEEQEKIRKDQEKQEKESLKRKREAFRNAIIQRDLDRKEDAKNEAEANRILTAESKRAAEEQEKIRNEEEKKEKESNERRIEAFRNAIIQRDLDRKEELKKSAEASRILADEAKKSIDSDLAKNKSDAHDANMASSASRGDVSATSKELDSARKELTESTLHLAAVEKAYNSLSMVSLQDIEKKIQLEPILTEAKARHAAAVIADTKATTNNNDAMANAAVNVRDVIKNSHDLAAAEQDVKRAYLDAAKAIEEDDKHNTAATAHDRALAVGALGTAVEKYNSIAEEREKLEKNAIATDDAQAKSALDTATKVKTASQIGSEAIREEEAAEKARLKTKEEAEKKGLELAKESLEEQSRLRQQNESAVAASAGNVARAESELTAAKEDRVEKEKKLVDTLRAITQESAKGAAADVNKLKSLADMRDKFVDDVADSDKKVIALEKNLATALSASGVTFKEVADTVRDYLNAQKQAAKTQSELIEAQDRYNKLPSAANLANLEAATKSQSAANINLGKTEQGLIELSSRSGAGVKELADSLIKTGQGMEEASTRSQHLSRAIYYSSQAAQDLNYGILAIMNNLPGMTEEFAKAGGANHEEAMKWAAGIGLVSSAFMALTMWGPQISKFFKKVDLTTLEGQIESVETKIKVLNAMNYVFHVDKRQLNELEVQLNDLEDRQKLLKAALEEKTVDEMQAEESAKKLLASNGGAQTVKGPNGEDVQITGAENIKRVLTQDESLLTDKEKSQRSQAMKDVKRHEKSLESATLEEAAGIAIALERAQGEVNRINEEQSKRGTKIMSDYLAAVPGSEKTFTKALERNRKPLEATGVDVAKLSGFAGEITSENAKKNRYSGDDFAFEEEEKVKEAIGKFDKADQEEARKVADGAKEPLEALDDFKKVVAERKSDAKAEAERVANAPMKERERRIDRAVSNVNREVRKAMDEKAEELEMAVGKGDLDEAGMDTARKKIEEAAKEKIAAIVNSVKSISDDIKQDVIDRVVPEAVLQIETDQVSGNAKQRIDKKADKAKEEAESDKTKKENKLKAEAKQIESSMGRRGLDVNTLKAMSEGANEKQLEEYLVPIITKHLKEGLGKTDEKEIAELASRVAKESIKNANDSVSGRGGDVQGALNEAYNKQPLVREAVAQERKAEGVQKKLTAKQQKAYNQANAQFEHHTGQLMQHFGPELNAYVAGMRAQGMGADEIMGQMGNGVAGRVMQAGYTEDQATELARRMLQRSIQQNFMGAAAKGADGNAADQWMGAISRSTSTMKNIVRAGNARAIQAQKLKKEQEEAARMARNSIMQQRSMNATNQ
jgi:hypothetical protein